VLSPGGVTVNAAQNYTFGGSGQLSGEMSLTKSGTGTLFLQTTNTFTGNITVSGGTLVAGTTDNQNLPDGANGYTGSVNAAGAFGKPGTAITLGDANTTASNASPMLLIGGAFTVGHPIIIANQPTTGTYTMGGSVDANSSFTNLITLNQPLTIVQAVNAGTNALTISGGIVSTNGLQKLTFAGPGNVYVTTAAIGDGSGQVAVNVTGGTLTLSSANSYTGATTVTNGLLQVNGSTAAGSAVTIGAGGRLSGTGVINSSTTVQSGGALSPGNPVGILAIGSNLTLGTGSTTFVQVEHSPLTNNGVDITGTLNEGGTLNVTNSGGASFAAGDSFQLFSAASYSGSFAGIVLPALTGNLVWNTNTLKNSGTLSVVTLTPPTIAGVNIAGGQLVVNGSGGVNSWPFMLLAATNLTAGSWLPVATNQFDPSGNFILTNTLNPNSPQTFYKLQLY
jgi:autotransporter-associated beta strand protein